MPRRHLTALAGSTALLFAAAVASPAAPAVAAPGAAPAFLRATSLCHAPAAGHFGCFAQVLVPAEPGSPGAVPATSVPGAGAGLGTGGYRPAQIAAAYHVDPDTPTDQVVAVVAAFGNPRARADLSRFDREYGLPEETAASFARYDQRGGQTAYPPLDVAWAGEQSLDLQAVRGMCHACRILLVEADSDADADLAAAENTAVALGATVVTNSFGEAEPVGRPIDPEVAAAFDHPGVVVVAGSGDDGFLSWDLANAGEDSAGAPFFPASLAGVVAVGGTSLLTDSAGERRSETVWNGNGPSDVLGQLLRQPFYATGGGCSGQVPAPSWQQEVAGWSGTGCGGFRLSADVAAVGDPSTGYRVYNSYATDLRGRRVPGWQTVGGTSLSAPIVAGIWALAGGSGGVAYPAATLYANLAAGRAPFDVVAGGNGWCGSTAPGSCHTLVGRRSPNTLGHGVLDCGFAPGSAALSGTTRACDAAPGYDGASGVGTPDGLAMFEAGNR